MRTRHISPRLLASLVTVLLMSLFLVLPALAYGNGPGTQGDDLMEYASDTWNSFVAMTYPSGLPADNMAADGTRSDYTSPTNIGTYMWSTIAARDLGFISDAEALARLDQTLDMVETMERHAPSGQFFNWYDPETGVKLTNWPPSGDPVYPFLSTVDNGWLAAALIMVSNAVPALSSRADTLVNSMDFGFYHDPDTDLLRGGYWTELPPNQVYAPNVSGGCETSPPTPPTGAGWTCHHYGSLNTEPRISSYIGIAMEQVPPTHYFKMWRTFPDTCDWNWHEMKPGGEVITYTVGGIDVPVFEGHYTYRGMNIVPSWGGSMFEALMVNLLVPEAEWGPNSWGINHPLYVQAQIEHGLEEAQYGYWGFSPSNNPSGGYREYGVDAIGMEPNGYASNNDNTWVDYGWDDPNCFRAPTIPPPDAYTNGVVTPHAAFLALEFAEGQALQNLTNLENDFNAYHDTYGFYDAINVDTGEVSEYFLALDQGMIMAALANELTQYSFRDYFAVEVQAAIQPLLAMETFTAGMDPTAVTIGSFDAERDPAWPLALAGTGAAIGIAVVIRRRHERQRD